MLAFAQTHPSFWDVADDMTALINAGATKSLQEAYEIAELRNPVTRARRLDAEREETAKAQAAKDAEKTGKAKAASATNVRSRGNARAAAPEESLDDTIRNGLAAIRARQPTEYHMASPNATFTELVSTTFRRHGKKFIDNVSKNNALLAWIMRNGDGHRSGRAG